MPFIVTWVEVTFVAVPVVTVGLVTEVTFVAVPVVTVDLGAETIFVAASAATVDFAEGGEKVVIPPGTTLGATSCGEKGVVNILSGP